MNTNKERVVNTSQFLSWVLRHDPQAIGLSLSTEGWVDIDLLLAAAAQHGRDMDRAWIEYVVANNDKKRFSLSCDGLRIRAVQGHSSASVSIGFDAKVPPQVLYHGTATRFLNSIRAQGLLPVSRQYVHLSKDVHTAIDVGKRYGTPTVLEIDACQMHDQGFKFYQAENGVWLTLAVPKNFLTEQCS